MPSAPTTIGNHIVVAACEFHSPPAVRVLLDRLNLVRFRTIVDHRLKLIMINVLQQLVH